VRTPGHAVLNLALLAPAVGYAPAVLAGAVAPDVPIAVLYVWERHVRGTPEETIWTTAYQRPRWQAVVHGAHSFPITLAGAGVAALLGAHALTVFFASMFVHALADLPVHAEDAHRHFVPLSDWRFVSPVSYWDVRHHARIVAALEALVVWAAAAAAWGHTGVLGRLALALVAAWYAHGYWQTFVRNAGRWQPYF
jgi:hypothetical protein